MEENFWNQRQCMIWNWASEKSMFLDLLFSHKTVSYSNRFEIYNSRLISPNKSLLRYWAPYQSTILTIANTHSGSVVLYPSTKKKSLLIKTWWETHTVRNVDGFPRATRWSKCKVLKIRKHEEKHNFYSCTSLVHTRPYVTDRVTLTSPPKNTRDHCSHNRSYTRRPTAR